MAKKGTLNPVSTRPPIDRLSAVSASPVEATYRPARLRPRPAEAMRPAVRKVPF
jgi:hypothetical protein